MALAVVLLAPAAAPAASIRVKLHRPHRGIQVRLAPVVVPAAQEREVCQAIELPNREPVDVAMLQFVTPGCRTYLSHHFALFVDDVDTMAELPTGPVNSPGCAGVGQAFGAILFGITSNDEMCFTIGAFYLDDDTAPMPPVPDRYGGDIALTCPWS
jgi:hypothetical protein